MCSVVSQGGMGALSLLLRVAAAVGSKCPFTGSCVAAGSRSLVAAVGGVARLAPDLHREREERHPLAPHDVPVVEDVAGDAVVLDEFLRPACVDHAIEQEVASPARHRADAIDTDAPRRATTAPVWRALPNHCLARRVHPSAYFTKSFLGDDAAVLVPSSKARRRHRAGVASIAQSALGGSPIAEQPEVVEAIDASRLR